MSLIEELLADRDRMMDEIHELRRFKANAIELIECQNSVRGPP